jgi:hypothetical protein
MAARGEFVNQVCADETGTAGYETIHRPTVRRLRAAGQDLAQPVFALRRSTR